MKPIDGFIGGAYDLPTVPATAQRSVNLYYEKAAGGECLIGTPGSTLEYTLPTGPNRGADVMNGRTFVVGGNALYETTGGFPVALGTLQTSVGRVGITNNDTTLLIVDGVAGYTYDGTFAVIDDPDFPNGVTQCDWEGQYFIVGVDGTKQFFISEVGTGRSWNGLDFASAENKPEILRSLIVNHDRLMLFTTTGSEQWVNTGNQELAFERDNGSSIEVGIQAPNSLVKLNSGVFFVGQDKDGGGLVFQMQGASPTIVSTRQLEKLLQSVDLSDAYAVALQMEGHACYVLTVPALEWTFVYDAATSKWHDRRYYDAPSATFTRWRPFWHVYNGKHLVGDFDNGNVYSLSTEVFTDNGAEMLRIRSSPPIAPYARVTFNRFAVDAEMGTTTGEESLIQMRYSNDNAKTWNAPRVASLGAVGEFFKRAMFWRCGSMREGSKRVFEVSTVAKAKVALFGAYIDATEDKG